MPKGFKAVSVPENIYERVQEAVERGSVETTSVASTVARAVEQYLARADQRASEIQDLEVRVKRLEAERRRR